MARWDESEGLGDLPGPSGPTEAEKAADGALAAQMAHWQGTDPDELALGLLEAHLRAVGEFNQDGSVWAPSLAGREDDQVGTDDRDETSNPPERERGMFEPLAGEQTPQVVTSFWGQVLPGPASGGPPEYSGPRGKVPEYRGKYRRRKPWWRFW